MDCFVRRDMSLDILVSKMGVRYYRVAYVSSVVTIATSIIAENTPQHVLHVNASFALCVKYAENINAK